VAGSCEHGNEPSESTRDGNSRPVESTSSFLRTVFPSTFLLRIYIHQQRHILIVLCIKQLWTYVTLALWCQLSSPSNRTRISRSSLFHSFTATVLHCNWFFAYL